MKRLLFIAVLSISTCVYSQNIAFEQALPLPPEPQITSNLIRVINGCSDFADVDGDNDQDLFITGEGEPINNSFYSHSQMYLNDGAGNFLAVVSPFDSVAFGSVAFADVDGDNDNDLLITGHYYYTTPFSTSLHKVAKLYANDGSGNFVEVTGTPFEPISFSSIDFADIDGDNDLDLILTGTNISGSGEAKLYTNDGLGNFTEVIGTPFIGVRYGAVAFADIDNDGDEDLFISGSMGGTNYASKVYTNDGLGNFTEVIGTSFIGVSKGSVTFTDVDNDNDLDLLIAGKTLDSTKTRLYTNDGLGNFTELSNMPFDGIEDGGIASADIDGDNDQDIMIIGEIVPSTNEYHYITKLYRNLLYTSTNYIDYNIDQICNIYPNPSEDVFNIILKSKEKQNLQLRVLNMLGEEVYTENLKGFVGNYTKQIMLGEYPDAIYLLEIRTSEGIVNKKLILQ